jgi:hypothetical protein
VNVLIALALFAQILDPLASQQAYTTADPNNTDRIGLATLSGRYAVTPIQDCDWIAPDQSVLIYPAAQIPPWLAITGLDGSWPGCTVRIEGRMSNTPCFQNTDGVCDWNAENAPE